MAASENDTNNDERARKSSRSKVSENDSNNDDTVLANSTNPHIPAIWREPPRKLSERNRALKKQLDLAYKRQVEEQERNKKLQLAELAFKSYKSRKLDYDKIWQVGNYEVSRLQANSATRRRSCVT